MVLIITFMVNMCPPTKQSKLVSVAASAPNFSQVNLRRKLKGKNKNNSKMEIQHDGQCNGGVKS
jgi:hypothetical protein